MPAFDLGESIDRQQIMRAGETASEDTGGRFGFNRRRASTLGTHPGDSLRAGLVSASASCPRLGTVVERGRRAVSREAGQRSSPGDPRRLGREAQEPSGTTPLGRALGRTPPFVNTCYLNRFGEGGHK